MRKKDKWMLQEALERFRDLEMEKIDAMSAEKANDSTAFRNAIDSCRQTASDKEKRLFPLSPRSRIALIRLCTALVLLLTTLACHEQLFRYLNHDPVVSPQTQDESSLLFQETLKSYYEQKGITEGTDVLILDAQEVATVFQLDLAPDGYLIRKKIGGIYFVWYTNNPILVYRNGMILSLQEAFTEGILNADTLSDLQQKHEEQNRILYREYDPEPAPDPPQLTEEEELTLTTAYRRFFIKAHPEIREESIGKAIVSEYYGKFDGGYAVQFSIEGISDPAGITVQSETVRNLVFKNADFIFYKNEVFYAVKDLEAPSLISDDALSDLYTVTQHIPRELP